MIRLSKSVKLFILLITFLDTNDKYIFAIVCDEYQSNYKIIALDPLEQCKIIAEMPIDIKNVNGFILLEDNQILIIWYEYDAIFVFINYCEDSKIKFNFLFNLCRRGKITSISGSKKLLAICDTCDGIDFFTLNESTMVTLMNLKHCVFFSKIIYKVRMAESFICTLSKTGILFLYEINQESLNLILRYTTNDFPHDITLLNKDNNINVFITTFSGEIFKIQVQKNIEGCLLPPP